MIKLSLLMREAEQMNPLPASCARLTALYAHDNWKLSEVVDTIKLDQVLTGRLLGIATSVAGGALGPVDSVAKAVVRLGAGMVLSLAVGSVVRKEMQGPLAAYGLDEGELWRHSVAASLAMEQASKYCRSISPTQACVAALLHDLGKFVLGNHLPAGTFVGHAESEAGGLQEESRIAGIHHARLGGLIARHWNLSAAIVTGITFHHSPDAAFNDAGRTMASFVALSDVVAHRIGNGCGTNEPRLSPDTVGRLGISRKGFDDLCETATRQLNEILAMYE